MMMQLPEMDTSGDAVLVEEFDVAVSDFLSEECVPESGSLDGSNGRDKALVYCIVVSLALHVIALVLLTRSGTLVPTRALLKPGEEVTSVRLVEPPQIAKEAAPPPEQASAISDRNHSTRVEQIPKQPPMHKPPLGRMEQPRLAALAPPAAPEDLLKQESEKHNNDREKLDAREKALKKDHEKPKQMASLDPKKNLRNLNVDLAPTPQEVAQGLSKPGANRDFYPDGDPEEVVVDINTREDRFFSYLLHLKQKIQGVWIYPTEAARSGTGGSLTVEFAIANDGRLLYANLLDSSGHNNLDQSALRAIQSAAPYYPFPPRMKSKRLRIRANFIYVTGNYFRRIM